MLLLLDENLPKRLRSDFPGHTVLTIKECGWNGISNGLLLEKLLQNNFDVLITYDKNLQYQQNFKKYPITVIVLSAQTNQYAVLTRLSPQILEILSRPLIAGPIEVKQTTGLG